MNNDFIMNLFCNPNYCPARLKHYSKKNAKEQVTQKSRYVKAFYLARHTQKYMR